MQVKKQQLELYMEQLTGSRVKKRVWQSCELSSCLFNLYREHIMRNARLDELQAGIKIGRGNINNLTYADDTRSNGRKWRGSKEPLDNGERAEWRSWHKTKY